MPQEFLLRNGGEAKRGAVRSVVFFRLLPSGQEAIKCIQVADVWLLTSFRN